MQDEPPGKTAEKSLGSGKRMHWKKKLGYHLPVTANAEGHRI